MANTERVALFTTCLVDSFYPEVGSSVIAVLERLGVAVDVPPGQTCCGQPAFNAGHRAEARTLARRFLRIFKGAAAVVAPSGSCVDMVRERYAELFEGDPSLAAEARDLAARTFEFSEYLVDQLGVEDIGAAYEGTVTYHDSCHLRRGLGVATQPRRLLQAVRGTKLVEMEKSDECCGFGGAFAIWHPEISAALGRAKADRAEATAAGLVIAADSGCIAQISGTLSRRGSPLRVQHLAEFLARNLPANASTGGAALGAPGGSTIRKRARR